MSSRKPRPPVNPSLRVTGTVDGAFGLLTLAGEARMEEVPLLEAEALRLRRAGALHLLLDCAGLVFMDSASIGAFLALERDATRAGGRLVLHGVPRPVERVLAGTGLSGRFLTALDERSARGLASQGPG